MLEKLVAGHRRVVAVNVLTRRSSATVLADLFEPTLDLCGERPHPRRRHLVLAEVLLPLQDRQRVRDSYEQVPWDVSQSLAASRPEEVEVSSLAGDSDGGEEDRVARKPFPERTSTITWFHVS